MKKAITILAICSLLLTACGQIDDTESKSETTTAIASESTAGEDTAETSSAKEEKDTSEATTTTRKSSQTVSSSSKPTGITVTTTKKSGSSGASGNSIQGQNNSVQNNNGQVNYQPEQNNQQPDNNQSNNGAQQNNQSSDNKPQNNNPSPPVTTAKPAVTNPPPTTTPKPQTEPPAPEPTEEERYMGIGRNLLHDGSDYSKAEAVYNWMTENGSGTCVNFSWQTYYLCKGTGLECYLAWTPSKLYGHVANVVKVNGTWFVLDTQGQGFLLNNDCGFSEIIDIDESYVSGADLISSQRYDEIY